MHSLAEMDASESIIDLASLFKDGSTGWMTVISCTVIWCNIHIAGKFLRPSPGGMGGSL